MRELEGKNAIVTGSNRGIGKAIVKKLSQKGCNVWACSREYNKTFEDDMKKISEENNVWIKPIYFDLRDSEQIKNGISQIFKDKQPIDALINNAGVTIYKKLFAMTSMSTIKELFDVNLFSVMEITQLCMKKMIKQKSGCIINMSSISAENILPAHTIYASSKAAIVCFTKNLASELGQYNIRVNAIAPGPIDTDILLPVKDYFENEYSQKVYLKKLGKAEDVANLTAFLLSEQASYINGQVIRVDGGVN